MVELQSHSHLHIQEQSDPIAGVPIQITGVGNTFFEIQTLNAKTIGDGRATENVPSTSVGVHTYIGSRGGIGKTAYQAITLGDGRATLSIAPRELHLS